MIAEPSSLHRLVGFVRPAGTITVHALYAAARFLRRYRRAVLLVTTAIFLADLLLLVTGYRLLVDEEFVPAYVTEPTAGMDFYLPGDSQPNRWSCTYWTGRSVQTMTFPADLADECPFAVRPRP